MASNFQDLKKPIFEEEKEREREEKSVVNLSFSTIDSASDRQPMIGPREMKLLREYVNGFELPRLKEANIRGRDEPDEPVPDTTDAHQRRRRGKLRP